MPLGDHGTSSPFFGLTPKTMGGGGMSFPLGTVQKTDDAESDLKARTMVRLLKGIVATVQ